MGKKMTNRQFCDRVAKDTGEAKYISKLWVDAVFKSLADALMEDNEICIRRLGKFYLKPRRCVNTFSPRTGLIQDPFIRMKMVFEPAALVAKKMKRLDRPMTEEEIAMIKWTDTSEEGLEG